MKEIHLTMTISGGIRIQFMLERKRYSLTPVVNGKFRNRVDHSYSYAIAQQIANDIQHGLFDETLEKYSPKPAKATEEEINKNNAQLIDLWAEYTESRRKVVSYNTYKLDYSRVERTIKECPYSSIKDSIKIIKWIIEDKPSGYSGYLLQQLNACCKWAVKSKLINMNPFKDYQDITGKRKNKEDYDIDPFSENERSEIINAFQIQYPDIANLVRFIFATGCRPSEAVALVWGDCVNGEINFNKSHVKNRTESRLKTQTKRVIAQNRTIKEILLDQKNRKKIDDSIVFIAARGKHINWSYFTVDIWTRVLGTLPNIKYRPPYQMRHTFITLALKAGVSPQDVARHVGNSPDMLFKHYAGVSRDFVMPEI
jgi:integrase